MLAWLVTAVSAVPARLVRPGRTEPAPVLAAPMALTVAPVVSAAQAAPVRQAALRVAVAVPPLVLTRTAVTAATAAVLAMAASAATV